MGLQVRCPLCGMTSVPDRYGTYQLVAKDVRSLGGNNGFEHVETDVPSELEAQIRRYIARLYHRYVGPADDPFMSVSVGSAGRLDRVRVSQDVTTHVKVK